jgi:hypothetical protein
MYQLIQTLMVLVFFVDNVQASQGAQKFVSKPPGALNHVIVSNTESFSDQQAK